MAGPLPFSMPPNYSGDANAASELIPIQIKSALNRDTFPGHIWIESQMHTMKKAGDALDADIGDAIAWIQGEQKELTKKITNYVHHMLNADTAGTEPPPRRVAKAIAAVVLFVKQVKEFISELQQLIQGLRDVILYLMSIIQRIQAFMQRILTAISTLINQICNFHLPSLPSLPNLFGDLHFDGFKFTKGMFNFRLTFDTHFAFGNCRVRNLTGNPLQDALQSWTSAAPIVYNPSGAVGASMTNQNSFLYVPPLPLAAGGPAATLPLGGDPADPMYQKTDGTWYPVLATDFTPQTDMVGSVPIPSKVVSAYTMPPTFLATQVLSILGDAGGITPDPNPVGTIGSATTPVSATIPWAQFISPIRTFCQSKVSLLNLEAASLQWTTLNVWDATTPDYTQTPAWAVAFAWLSFMNQCRRQASTPVEALTVSNNDGTTFVRSSVNGRGGSTWIPSFQAIFREFVAADQVTDPFYADLTTAIPWNTTTSGPEAMAFFTKLAGLEPATRGQVLWALSYLEAALLGYERTTAWDSYAPGGPDAPATPHPLAVDLVTGPTGADLDYQQLPSPRYQAPVLVHLTSGGLAKYPSVLTVPDYLVPTLNLVLGWAEADILNQPKYESSNLRSMYVYTAQATAVLIDAYSQFWRDFSANWQALLELDPALQAMVFNYPKILYAALSPRVGGAPHLGMGIALNPQDAFVQLKQDFTSRTGGFGYHYEDPLAAPASTLWVPGWPWLHAPSVPEIYLAAPANPTNPGQIPYGGLNAYGEPVYAFPQFADDPLADGWDRVPDPDDPTKTLLAAFNPTAFYQRSDIKALPYNEQVALAGLHQAFDEVVNTGAALLCDNQDTINACYASLADAQAQVTFAESMATTYVDANGNPYLLDASGHVQTDAQGNALTGVTGTPVPMMMPPVDANGNLTMNPGGAPVPNDTVPINFTTVNQPAPSIYAGSPTIPPAPDPASPPPPASPTAPVFQAPGTDPSTATATAKATRLLRCRKQVLGLVPTPV